MKFYLGTHLVHWLWTLDVPLFMSHRRLIRNKKLYPATCSWALDSGGFSELSLYGEWRTTPRDYVKAIHRYQDGLGRMEWAAQQDWMCEDFILKKTGYDVKTHQRKTVENYLELLTIDSSIPFIPVLQGFTKDEYYYCADLFYSAGIDLANLPLVGIGSVCRRQATTEVEDIVKSLDLNLHGFGIKKAGLVNMGQYLVSADSMAWSFNARYDVPLPDCAHIHCGNCMKYALKWREEAVRCIN